MLYPVPVMYVYAYNIKHKLLPRRIDIHAVSFKLRD